MKTRQSGRKRVATYASSSIPYISSDDIDDSLNIYSKVYTSPTKKANQTNVDPTTSCADESTPKGPSIEKGAQRDVTKESSENCPISLTIDSSKMSNDVDDANGVIVSPYSEGNSISESNCTEESSSSSNCDSNIVSGYQTRQKKREKEIPKLKIKPKELTEFDESDLPDITLETYTAKQLQSLRRSKLKKEKERIKAAQKQNKRIRKSKMTAKQLEQEEYQLISIPTSVKERSVIYSQAANAISYKEGLALPSHGGRCWRCHVTIKDSRGACGTSTLSGWNPTSQKSKVNRNNGMKPPLFRWYHGNLELACLPQILERIDVVDINHGTLKSVLAMEFDDVDDENALSDDDSYKEETFERIKDMSEREVTPLSAVAWDEEEYEHPQIDRRWISPNNLQTFRTRNAALEHAALLFEQDKLIDRVLFGHGARGGLLRPMKPTRNMALGAGLLRFQRDGLWLIGQEEEWVEERIAEWKQLDDEGDKKDSPIADTSIVSSDGSPDPNISPPNTNATSKAISKKRRIVPKSFTPSTHWRLTDDQIVKCYDAVMDFYNKVMYTVKARALHSELSDGFDVFRERGRGRYDMNIPIFDTPDFSFLTDLDASWMPVVKKILGDDVVLVHKGAFLSLPGSDVQVYHQDGTHLTTKCQRPCHAINVFIPLVDLNEKNGPTEFCIGTHLLGYEDYSYDMVYTPLPAAGTPVIFDYRLGHRGMGNSSTQCRPLVYLTYTSASNEFRDAVNFSKKRYRKLGDLVEAPLTREERALKRMREC